MMKFVKKKSAATSPQQAVEISRPSNLIVSKHKLVRTEGDFILIMEDDKVIGLLDRRDLDLNVVAVPQHAPPPPPASLSPPSSSQSQQYLAPLSSNRTVQPELEPPAPQSPVGVSPNAYRSLPPGFSSKHHQQQHNPALYQFQFPQNNLSPDQSAAYKWTSVEQLFSPPIPTNTRNRSETGLQPQGSHKYDTITFAPGVQLPGSSSAQCNVEIRLGDERAPPPPTRAPPAPLTMSPVHCAVVLPEEVGLAGLSFTEVQSVSVEDPELAGMTIDDMRKHAEDFECFIQEQVQQRWTQEKAETERWIKNIAGKVAKTETMNTIRGEMSKKKRPSLTEVFSSPHKSPSLDPTDPVPNYDYEKLYVSETSKSPLKRQQTQESDGDIEDIRF